MLAPGQDRIIHLERLKERYKIRTKITTETCTSRSIPSTVS
jgi:hypothetical protein